MGDLAKSSIIVALAFGLGASGALAQQSETTEEPAPVPAPPIESALEPPMTEAEARAERLDQLFDRLADAEARDWESVQNEINALWNESGSPSMDLLARRADKAMAEQDYTTALVHLDDLTRLAPNFAEGWNKRATVYFLQENYGRSLEDIARTLRLEPRHFGALSGLGIILDRLGDSEGALEAYRRVQRIHPNLEGTNEGIKKLTPEVDGQRL